MKGTADMNIHVPRTNASVPMNAITIAQTLERKERQRGNSIEIARRTLAARLKVGVGTLENLVRGRVKRVDAAIRDRLQALLVREYEQEIARLQHELEILRQCGAALNSDQVCEVEAHRAKASAVRMQVQ